MVTYYVKNWKEFQHYRDRNPPWIKLHKKLIDDFDFHALPDASKALAPLLWILASMHEDPESGAIDGPDEAIAFRLHMDVKKFQSAMKPLLNSKFFSHASDVLADCYQDAPPEYRVQSTEKETDKRKNTKKEKIEFTLPSDIPQQDWFDYVEMRAKIKKPMTDTAKKMAVDKLYALRDKGYDIAAVLQQSTFNDWQGLFEVRGVTPVSPSTRKEIKPIDLGLEGEGLAKVFAIMRAKYGDSIFQSWLSPIRVKAKQDKAIKLSIPSKFMREWINSHYGSELAIALRSVWPDIEQIEMLVEGG